MVAKAHPPVIGVSMVRKLREAGFIHVTGLPFCNPFLEQEGFIQIPQSQYGCWGHCDNKTILVTETGQVWIVFDPEGDQQDLIGRICPKGQGISLPFFVEGMEIPFELAIMRIRNPYDDYEGPYPPDQNPKG